MTRSAITRYAEHALAKKRYDQRVAQDYDRNETQALFTLFKYYEK